MDGEGVACGRIDWGSVRFVAPAVSMKPSVLDVQRAVCRYAGISRADLKGRNRKRFYVRPRIVAMYLARELTGQSFPLIGRLFDRDHTTCLSAWRRVGAQIAVDTAFAAKVEQVRSDILSGVQSRAGASVQ